MVYMQSGECRPFKWQSNHAFGKITAEEPSGLLSMVENNQTTEFAPPLYKH
jgi:hypothetical protein